MDIEAGFSQRAQDGAAVQFEVHDRVRYLEPQLIDRIFKVDRILNGPWKFFHQIFENIYLENYIVFNFCHSYGFDVYLIII